METSWGNIVIFMRWSYLFIVLQFCIRLADSSQHVCMRSSVSEPTTQKLLLHIVFDLFLSIQSLILYAMLRDVT